MAEQLSLLNPKKSNEPRIVYFDIETLRSAVEVGGWSNISKMGVACAVCYDSIEDKYFEYVESQVPDLLVKLSEADLIVGYNIIRFDYVVLQGYSKVDFSRNQSFDILVDVTRILGHRLKLDSIVQATLGVGKTGDGLQSLQWVKEGRFDLISEYCKKDVELTRDLFLFGLQNKYIYYQNYGEKIKIPVEWSLQQLIK
ncbi:MAG: hypothetical protein KDD48_05565 [Bdellovibrionales bacterium]|nr:hypothetical protein [Bdellovibrionales bacterium]